MGKHPHRAFPPERDALGITLALTHWSIMKPVRTAATLLAGLALTAAIWHNDNTGNPTLRSLTPYDH